ncbi:hypothetical protein GE061_001487 [Apolygus lucorum]|uniref:Putative hydroxypyruvate isomerase n=1 Tax=Apolygus lucorum TaxID=248454 RepID=A0A8S9Y8Q8_APOLU|nr:hypothetical protein GE061_001487 [Apolygus lucorum]
MASIQRFKICANLDFMFQEHSSLVTRYSEAARLGFKGVETAVPYKVPEEELLATLKQTGLTQVLINTPVGDVSRGEVGFASLPGKENAFLEGVQKAISYATTLQCKLIHIMAGLVTEHPLELHEKTYVQNLRKAVPLLEKAGIVAVIEPINQHSVPNYFLSDYDKAVSVIESLKTENFGLLLDLFHLQQIKGNVTRNIEKYLPYTKHVQIAQVPERHEPNSFGELNYSYIFHHLNECKYSDWVGLEYRPAKSTSDGLNWADECGVNF